MTFNDLEDYWLEKRARRTRSEEDDKSIIRKHLRPAFGTMLLRNIGVEEVDDYVNENIDDEELVEKIVASQVTLLTTLLNSATTFKVPWLTHVPPFNKPKVPLFSRDYQWLRSDEKSRASSRLPPKKEKTSTRSTRPLSTPVCAPAS